MTPAGRRLLGLLLTATMVAAVAGVWVVRRTGHVRPSAFTAEGRNGSAFPADHEEVPGKHERPPLFQQGAGERRHAFSRGDTRGESPSTAEPLQLAAETVAGKQAPWRSHEALGGPGEAALGSAPVAEVAMAIMDPPRPPTPPPPPSPDETALRQEMKAVVSAQSGTELAYAVCEGNGQPCRARIQARDLDSVSKAAQLAQAKYSGQAQVEVRELPTAYNGRYFVADIQVGGSAAGGAAAP